MRGPYNTAELRQALETEHRERLLELFDEAHPSNLAESLMELSPCLRSKAMELIPDALAGSILDELSPAVALELLRSVTPERVTDLLSMMSSDNIADMLEDVQEEYVNEILAAMHAGDAKQVKQLLGYDPATAGGIMTTDYMAFRSDLTVGELLERLPAAAHEVETIYYIYVINDTGRLVGVVSLRDIIQADARESLGTVMKTSIITVTDTEDQEKVAQTLQKYGLLAIPVVSSQGQLLGIVTFDDVVDVVQEEVTEDVLKLAGVSEEEVEMQSGSWLRARRRLPWLLIALFGELVSGKVISGFSHALEAVVALSFYIPVLMDMGGNVGTQSVAIMVRGLATNQLDSRYLLRYVLRETGIGVVVGSISGLLTAGVALLWQGSARIGLAVGVAMAITLTIAATMGIVVPLLLHRFGRDPAVASGPFVTTTLDIAGLFIYFTSASMILGL